MRKWILVALLLCSVTALAQVRKAKAQIVSAKVEPIKMPKDTTTIRLTFNRMKRAEEKWFKFNQVTLNMSEVAFSNWSAGGENSVSGLMTGRFRRRYTERTFFWDNILEIDYGINAQTGRELRKTDDKFLIVSSFGYRGNTQSYWYYTARYQLLTQMSNGYKYPDTDHPISKLFAPAYITFGLGAEYAPQRVKLNLFLSPMTLKTTVVLNKALSEQGAFGVEQGKRTNSELGFSISGRWDKKLMENMDLNTNFTLYGDYLKNFGNIDIDWETGLNLKVNNYVQARIGLHIKYDDDVKFESYKDNAGVTHSYGARTQFKQLLGVGVLYTF